MCIQNTVCVWNENRIRIQGNIPGLHERGRDTSSTLRRDNAQSEKSEDVTMLNREFMVSDQFTEPHHPQQNPAEVNGVKFLKEQAQLIMNRTGAPSWAWFLAMKYVCYVHNKCANVSNGYKIPLELATGEFQDISEILCFRSLILKSYLGSL